MNNTSNTGSSLITGSGINTLLTPSSVGVNPTSRGELMLNGALGNAFSGGTTGPTMQGSSGAGFGAPDFVNQQRNQIKANMSGNAFFNNEDEENDDILKKIRQLIEQANMGMGGQQQQQNQQPFNFAGQQYQQPNNFFGNNTPQNGVLNLKPNM